MDDDVRPAGPRCGGTHARCGARCSAPVEGERGSRLRRGNIREIDASVKFIARGQGRERDMGASGVEREDSAGRMTLSSAGGVSAWTSSAGEGSWVKKQSPGTHGRMNRHRHDRAHLRRCGSTLLTVAVAAVCLDVVCGLAATARPFLRPIHWRPPALSTCKMSTNSVGSFVDESPAGKTAFEIAWERAQQRALTKHKQELVRPSSLADDKMPGSSVDMESCEAVPDAESWKDSGNASGHHNLVGVWAAWLNENCPPDLTSALAGLTDERASQRKAAVARLLTTLPSGQAPSGPAEKHWAWAALAARLGDDSAGVREAAVKGLAAISDKGNRNAVLAMASLIEEEKAITVRTAALQALTRVAQRGDEEALAPVLNLLRRVEGVERGDVFTPNLSSGIKRQAVKALSTLAVPGNEGAIKALMKRMMDDPKPEVREAAIRGLAGIACPSDPQIIWALSMSCADEDENVRRTAQRKLGLLVKRQEARQVLKRSAASSAGAPPALIPENSCGDSRSERDSDDDSHARVFWLLPGIWEA